MTFGAIALFALVGLAYPHVFPAYMTVGISMLLFIGWATAWDILGGWAGQVSLGHSAFVGLGAYVVAIGQIDHGLAPWITLPLAMLAAAALAWLWGSITFGLRGPYFTLSTIAVAEILRLVAINEGWLTGGATGVFIATLPEPFGIDFFERATQFYMALVFALVCLGGTAWMSMARFGYQLRAVREDENAAMAAGIDPRAIKLRAFMVSGALTAAGGGIYGIFLSFLEPHIMFYLLLSIQIALTAIIGGRGTIFGPLVGAVLIIGAGEIFRTAFAEANLLIYGLLILIVVLFMPRGILGEAARNMIRRRYARRSQG
ncbi:branched-chain amino acid ABC transporter permease [Roseovarius nanhaiticus]|uniref:Branched-chain amino acid transport system permease protein n=1 Tax=Roseovarius nanhaiticus TaxID=573024 RepID=A0A1N7HIZ6_9RHOB|nr:branched-chain amino acid ABC transporter permease [Roseovarius nanhaiticus]SEK92052.1 amino acid/amide ABC transporter membrane protein 2, HAAT family [Roseovarius nanhaiticus]SIS24660.1 branched-chain amino acid transport system permease protein [Roseovarius nanhaiticus]